MTERRAKRGTVQSKDNPPKLVRLTGPGGFVVPERWTTTSAIAPQAELALSVVVLAGDPHVESATIKSTKEGSALSADAVKRLGLAPALEAAVRSGVLLSMARDDPKVAAEVGRAITTGTDVLDGDDIAAAWAEASRKARSAVRRPRITRDDLREVIELHAEGGIDLIRAKRGTTERNARRLLARARKELS